MELISRDKAQEIIPKVVLGMSDFAECIRDSVDTVFDNCPSAFEGMTNGEVIQALFPNSEVVFTLFNVPKSDVIKIDNEAFLVERSWWDSPYKGVNEE